MITVGPRIVAAPWELKQRTARRVWVGTEAEVAPEPGPLALYRSAFPHRRVTWNRFHQLFEIVDDDGFQELVFWWDAKPEPDREFDAEQIAQMVEDRDGRPVRRWSAFDYAFVWRRIRELWEFNAQGTKREQKLVRRILDHNANVERTALRVQRQNVEDWMRDDRRYLPELVELQRGALPAEAKVHRIPIVQGFSPN